MLGVVRLRNARMTRPRLGVLLAVIIVVGSLVIAAALTVATNNRDDYTFAVIGDVPYTPAQEALLPRWVDQINAEPDVAMVAHLGDIKAGSKCTDEYFAKIRHEFDRFSDPLVYTPGDNEWTDCHNPAAGEFDPLERLDAIRKIFFNEPRRTLGRDPMRVKGQHRDGYPENVSFTRGDVAFAAVHLVGSDNGLAAWTGKSAPTSAQAVEVLRRTAAAIELIEETFEQAEDDRNRAVVLLTQADMFLPAESPPGLSYRYAFQPIVATIARETRAFNGSVYLFNGDSHTFNVDRPLAAGEPWTDFYGIDEPVNNLTRITVEGAGQADEYLKVTIRPEQAEVVSWQRVPLHG